MDENDIQRLESKLDQVLVILHGDGRGDFGLVQKVNILWTVVMRWPLYTASALAGSALTLLVQRLFTSP